MANAEKHVWFVSQKGKVFNPRYFRDIGFDPNIALDSQVDPLEEFLGTISAEETRKEVRKACNPIINALLGSTEIAYGTSKGVASAAILSLLEEYPTIQDRLAAVRTGTDGVLLQSQLDELKPHGYGIVEAKTRFVLNDRPDLRAKLPTTIYFTSPNALDRLITRDCTFLSLVKPTLELYAAFKTILSTAATASNVDADTLADLCILTARTYKDRGIGPRQATRRAGL